MLGNLYEYEGQLQGGGSFLGFLVPSSQGFHRQVPVALYQVAQGCLCLQQLLQPVSKAYTNDVTSRSLIACCCIAQDCLCF